ncbi:glycosyl hydrolase [Neolewinella lacunae]|uniref:Glycosyl hydrolase n=1 Tax=Neolewinella lacunae TaxID=1517758 RepID=A0A923T882_9BACT|nr:glycosyl hydrolase [Neolewinella lacunae]MBC6994284.1 glycosyl hydrolase [Neolewinella lacunae]MDN3635338.1 glycosyl hydrolase [Neolewinella lacunae]
MKHYLPTCLLILAATLSLLAQPAEPQTLDEAYSGLAFRNIGPFRGGRTNAVTGVPGNPLRYYFGGVGGGVWQTDDAGQSWFNITDGQLNTSSVGAIAVAPSDPNVLYLGTGEHAVRGVMTSAGDGVYKSTDAGKTWTHLGLEDSRHIAEIRVHPRDPDLVYVAVQGALHGDSETRGVYRSKDGGENWERILYYDNTTGAADLSLDPSNPRILYAGMWEHRRFPWAVKSGGPGSGLYKSTDGGDTWKRLTAGLPDTLGKVAIDVSPANPNRVFANLEAAGDQGGVYRSDDAGATWTQVSSDRVTVARAWYYIEIFADPGNENTVYVLNAPMLKSIDGGKSFRSIDNPHSDQHDLWINPANPQNLILGNDGGACISFNGGQSWSTQQNQPTAQFYRVITDEQFPYHVYAGQQDNSAVDIVSRTRGGGIGWKDWKATAGGESAFLAFDPKNPRYVYGGSYQGNISVYDNATGAEKDIMAYPVTGLATLAKNMRYRFNWNAPIVAQPQDPSVLYHAANVVLRSTNGGDTWTAISQDLTRNDPSKQEAGGFPFTNEGAGGENYNTITYLVASPHRAGDLWVGTDDGMVWRTQNEGQEWQNITPKGLGEVLINAIEVSPHDPATAYLAVTGYKFNDFRPNVYITTNGGKTWTNSTAGIAPESFVRVVREDPKRKGLLYAGTEHGLYVSLNGGKNWEPWQLNLPNTPVLDLTIRDNDLVVATGGRAFWILDDLSALQQAGAPGNNLMLVAPKPTYRYNLATPSAPDAGEGANPASGISFDYYLPAELDTAQLQIDILDASGSVVRSYTNQEVATKSWLGGPPPAKVLPSNRGMNRFNWDLRRSQLPAVEGVFILGDYRGSLVPPGTYTIRLTTPESTHEVKAELLPDPSLEAGAEEYAAQQALLLPIEATVKDIHQSVNRMRKVKTQLQSLDVLLQGRPETEPLLESGQRIIEQITEWEESLIQPRQKTFQDVINFPNQLTAELMDLKSRVDGAVPSATTGARQRLTDLKAEWARYQAILSDIVNRQIGDYNNQYKSLGLPALIIPTTGEDGAK